ncbi:MULTISPECIES: type I methionyl aminopeptidase [Microbacterium]|uniref:Methionine aminopeptidase n=1 Tax=Microbacterium testaceum TaxID=2033 RepID=A0A4Y3QG19_MICTE|nr:MULTISPECIES: type I methionyl aminopeptidase [Microbacterium]MDZ5145775.1 type I methionyl aminopeptidase [Microbacterium testaceum]REC99847.1 methionine aminopeptidase type I [Microbacterium sp. AG157]WJS91441.1 type I methionyl aminopeptidase [Microbacterium testaceum]GEB44084.1 methionine aminopeptidase [Microbacterium testaceum]
MGLRSSIYKKPAQLRSMIEPGLITADALDAVRALIAPGVTTLELDAAASALITARGAVSNFQMVRGYRHTVCASVNEQVVHGIPNDRPLQAGDILSIDAGAEFRGWNGDSAFTVIVPGDAPEELVAPRRRLSEVTEGSLWAGIAALSRASHLSEVGAAIEQYIDDNAPVGGYGILRDYVGHGIGRKMHESPSIFNYAVADRGPEVRPGLAVAIEPMVVIGDQETFTEDDGWTVSTVDGSAGSHWEHSVAVHDGGIWVLTAHDGGAEKLAPFGVVPKEID